MKKQKAEWRRAFFCLHAFIILPFRLVPASAVPLFQFGAGCFQFVGQFFQLDVIAASVVDGGFQFGYAFF
jgi:hypothetical protein